jgi:hypothetical protein
MSTMIRVAIVGPLVASIAVAQGAPLPPVRTLPPAIHVSTELLGRVPSALRLRSGRVLVNDVLARRLLLFDSTLATFTVVADSASGAALSYGARPGGLLAFRGDSVLFIDPASLAMMVLDGNGQLARVMSVPRPDDAGLLVMGGQFGTAGFDAQGRLVYRGQTPRVPTRGPDGKPLTGLWLSPDSAPLVRYDLVARKLDTLAQYKIPRITGMRSVMPNGGSLINMIDNPLATTDDWAILRDGTVAVFRGIDYHVDWFGADGSRTASPKIPFEWHRLDDSAKVAFVDSLRAQARKRRAEQESGGGAPTSMSASGSGGLSRGAATAPFPLAPVEDLIAQPGDLPDYAPPFAVGTARQDFEGNIWIRTTFAVNGGVIYDVISGKGALTDRVSLPAARAIAGYGPGVVYLAVREGAGVRLEVVKIH